MLAGAPLYNATESGDLLHFRTYEAVRDGDCVLQERAVYRNDSNSGVTHARQSSGAMLLVVPNS